MPDETDRLRREKINSDRLLSAERSKCKALLEILQQRHRKRGDQCSECRTPWPCNTIVDIRKWKEPWQW